MSAPDTSAQPARPGDELSVDEAIQKLSDSLRDAEYAIPITHGAQFVWRRCTFQAHASPAQFRTCSTPLTSPPARRRGGKGATTRVRTG